ncbi:pyruvate carboxylase [Terramyces sp. JEL0728]|nr:pyruvate carboxylase [Terramyces sp. JEL0728]
MDSSRSRYSSVASLLASPKTDFDHENALLVANRGEIAIRVVRAGHQLGHKTITIYSPEDSLSMHRYVANESYQIGDKGEFTPVGAYLAIDRIVSIAKHRRVTVIHPGYGFLSENSLFAKKVEEAGIAFVGPPPEIIDSCGDKTKARELAKKANVPVVPGSEAITNFAQAAKFIEEYGFPIIIKAAFGGGGRGMRVVKEIGSFQQLFDRAQSEALTAFGDGTVFLERFLEKPKHIEVQLLADNYGNVIHLYERDCSVQRRHQKVVEMGPALNLPEDIRNQILSDAVKLAKTVGYRNAGTAEFLVDKENRHYFIEINPRIQVEHTVTEELTGIDLVGSQIQIALGASLESLGLIQEKIAVRGVAIQCRITTEDPSKNFQPDTGRIILYRSPGGRGVRLDGGPGYTGAIITPYYDSLLVKCTCSGKNFEKARHVMLTALAEFRVRGLKTNIPFVTELLNHPTFVEGGKVWTTFIDDTPELFKAAAKGSRSQKLLRYLGELAVNGFKVAGQQSIPALQSDVLLPQFANYDPQTLLEPCITGWRNILLSEGPEAFCAAVRKHSGLLIMDTTWRDAHQSLLATRVRTIDIAQIATATSHVFKNMFALECWGGATFDVSLRFLSECPWERLKSLRKLVPNIPFQMLLRGANAVGYTSYPDNVVFEFCKKARECGVDIFRIFDSLNYDENLQLGVDAVIAAGGVAEAAISYTGDVSNPNKKPYDLDYYLKLTAKLVKAGIHILAIKDMAGLLKPKAARMLIGAIRAKHPNLVIHVHTHDTAGTGVASMIAAAEAGADVVDAAIDSMSGLTSQPSLGAIVSALEETPLDTGIKAEDIFSVNSYWEQIRLLYSCFDPNVKSSDSGVYLHEMPGGQYTNLLFQSQQLGLGDEWIAIKKAYQVANKLCGDITKVTPSSKVVGDFAQFMVSQKLTEQDVYEKAEILSFPQSVLEYYQGFLGQPPFGFPESLRNRILSARNLPKIEGRPGKSLPPLDFNILRTNLEEKYGDGNFNEYDLLSSALYPKVFEEYKEKIDTYGDLSILPTRWFLTPLKVGQEFTFDIALGRTLIVKLVAIGPLNEETLSRDIYFTLNGEARLVNIVDTVTNANKPGAAKLPVRPKANAKNKGEVGAPMSGIVVDLRVSEGTVVKVGDPIAVMSAMKMETIVTATMAGKIEQILVSVKDSLSADDLIAVIKKKE